MCTSLGVTCVSNKGTCICVGVVCVLLGYLQECMSANLHVCPFALALCVLNVCPAVVCVCVRVCGISYSSKREESTAAASCLCSAGHIFI